MASELPQEIIRKKRDGGALSPDQIKAFIQGLTNGAVSEGQAAAFAMAVFLRGMSRAECVALTDAMARSGECLDWSGEKLGGPVIDKHSTGGIGDKVSLILAPLLAACGAFVPMISGRGLGHTGGTLDKLDAILGYRSTPDIATLKRVVREAGCAIIGQTAELAPADRRFYAIRDVTATVESVPLITASILSKKLAAGLDALVMDVKFGSGAFASTLESARELGSSIVAVGNGARMKTTALLTDMNQVLGRAAGNALETLEAIEHLTGRARDPRLLEVTLALGAALLVLCGLVPGEGEARKRLENALASGAAAERFARMVAGLGGPKDLLEHPDKYLAKAPVVVPALPQGEGRVGEIDVRALGLAIVILGGGRMRADGVIDPAVGLTSVKGIGESVGRDRPLAMVHARDKASAERAAAAIAAAYRLGAGEAGPLIAGEIRADTVRGAR
ncbi:MAG: thymidine phosphorylase [Alphaproteobacteria bacterium]|nr:thymidine phosphorylase [Alphaproteobacteria bacterium]